MYLNSTLLTCPSNVLYTSGRYGLACATVPKLLVRHLLGLPDLFHWPCVVPDQKAHKIGRLLAEEAIPFFGVPEAFLSDRGTNLLSHLMTDLCQIMGITKLNTTAYYPECDGIVE